MKVDRYVIMAIAIIVAAALIMTVVLVATAPSTATGPKTITKTVDSDGRLTKLRAAINQLPINGTLNSNMPFTLFAPTDAAFDAADPALINTTNALWNTLMYHYTGHRLNTTDMYTNMTLAAGDGGVYLFTVNTTGTFVNDARIVDSIQCTNGVIHVIDRVLTPPMSIWLTAFYNGNFSLIESGLFKTGQYNALTLPGNFTLFATPDAVLSGIDGAKWSTLFNQTDKLNKTLSYHLLPYRLMSSNMTTGAYTTVEGNAINITVNSTGTYVNNAKVVTMDIICRNGVIHIIDRLQVPPDVTV